MKRIYNLLTWSILASLLCAGILQAQYPPRISRAKFGIQNIAGKDSLNVFFTNQATGNISEYHWFFDDSTKQSYPGSWTLRSDVEHMYRKPGVYTPVFYTFSPEYYFTIGDISSSIIPQAVYVDSMYDYLPVSVIGNSSLTLNGHVWDHIVDGDPLSWVYAEKGKVETASVILAAENATEMTLNQIRILPEGIFIDVLETYWDRESANRNVNHERLTGKKFFTNVVVDMTIETSLDQKKWDIIFDGPIGEEQNLREVYWDIMNSYWKQWQFFFWNHVIDPMKLPTAIEKLDFHFDEEAHLWDTIVLDEPVTAKYIRVSLNETQGLGAKGFELSEIQFFGTSEALELAKNSNENTLAVKSFELSQNYPNPFNPTTDIQFSLPQSADILLKIYNVRGQLVKLLVDNNFDAGTHQIQWDATSNFGSHVAAGMYIYHLEAKSSDGRSANLRRKMLLIK